MTLKDEILEGLKYPVNNKKSIIRFLIGCAFNYIPIAGSIISLGYAQRSMGKVMEGEKETPLWVDFVGFFLLGAKVLGVLLVYGLGFLVPFSIGLFFVLVIKAGWAVILGFIFFMISAILAMSCGFVVPMALIFMLKRGERFKAALKFDDVLLKIRDMATPYTISVAIFWVSCIILLPLILLFISIKFGFIFAVIPIFYLLLFGSFIFGKMGNSVEISPLDSGILVDEAEGRTKTSS